MIPLLSSRGLLTAHCISSLGLTASFNSPSHSGLLSKSHSYLEEEWAQWGRQALALFVVLSFHVWLHSLLDWTRSIRLTPFQPSTHPEAACSQGACIYTAASFFPHYFQMCYGMFLAAVATLHVFSAHGSDRLELKNVLFSSAITAPRFTWVFWSLAAVAVTGTFHMHA